MKNYKNEIGHKNSIPEKTKFIYNMPLAVLFLTGLDTYAQTASESNQDNANIA
jgi:hypothetical protein